MKKWTIYLWLPILLFGVTLAACGSGDSDGNSPSGDSFDVSFDLPASVDVALGGTCTFTVRDGKAPLASDSFILESSDGISYVCPIVETSAEKFSVRFSEECEAGYYGVFIKRDQRKKSYGRLYLNIVEELPEFTPDAGTTVYGRVSTSEGGVPGVVVSDGVEVTTTDENGIYQMRSAKKWGYVFISVPSGYEAPSQGILPQFHQSLKSDAQTLERVDFSLVKINGQDTYKIFMFGDMHLANRTSDVSQFGAFTSDLNDYMAAHRGELMYALTLGDMTWDLYWYSNNFYFPEYLDLMNSQVKGLQVFHTMGNHDNDMYTKSDYAAAVEYVNHIAPTYYSFNIGKIHFVVLDDIDCSGYDGTDSRNYAKGITSEQLNWLAKDLQYVDKSTPLVVAMHAQLFYPASNGFKIDHDASGTESLFRLLEGYEVHFVTGHTHMMFNVTPQDAITSGRNFHEHNAGSVCGSWWWSGHLTPGVHLGQDGSPGGYSVWDVSGTKIEHLYKATGWPEEYQFRSYDLNCVSFSSADIPLCPSSVKDKFDKYIDAYPATSSNEVLINIWNWNSNWTLSVVDERGKSLDYTPVWAYDPLHIAAMTVPRFNNAGISSTPNFITSNFTHFFKVKADDANVDLTITVKDEFGHTWSEKMVRPKAFSVDAYTNE